MRLVLSLALLAFAGPLGAVTDPFAPYYAHGRRKHDRRGAPLACAQIMANSHRLSDDFARRLDLNPAASNELIQRLRRTLDFARANGLPIIGVMVTGSRVHRLHGGQAPIELLVITPPGADASFMHTRLDLMRADSIEANEFTRAFGAREYQTKFGVYVTATLLRLPPERVPTLDKIAEARATLARDLAEVEAAAKAPEKTLPPQNVFAREADLFDGDPAEVFDRIARFGLDKAFWRVFGTSPGVAAFAAGSESLFVFSTSARDKKAWVAELTRLGYERLLSVNPKGELALIAPAAPAKTSARSPKPPRTKRTGGSRAPKGSPVPPG